MKCPKCGKGNLLWNEREEFKCFIIGIEHWSCSRNCAQKDGYVLCNFICSEEDYQQLRLDKVLSKFEKDTRTIERKVFLEPHDDNYVLIDYDHKTFYLVSSNMNYEISLETVESLLNDLSDNK